MCRLAVTLCGGLGAAGGLGAPLAVIAAGCGSTQTVGDGAAGDDGPRGDAVESGDAVEPGDAVVADAVSSNLDGPGTLAFMHPTDGATLLGAQPEALPRPIKTALDPLSAGTDKSISISEDGAWLALITTRFGCGSWECLAVVPADLSSGAKVVAGGDVHPEAPAAIASGGQLIVYIDAGQSGHTRDLYVVRKSGGSWSGPTRITGGSGFLYNLMPRLSADATKVLFDCGDAPFTDHGLGICEVGVDGTGFRQILMPGVGSWGATVRQLHSADYAPGPGGGLVFEADRFEEGEGVWALPADSSTPIRLGNFGNDNSPCVLGDGRIASLYLARPGGSGVHEIKIMTADGQHYYMALTDVDVLDVGLSCGG